MVTTLSDLLAQTRRYLADPIGQRNKVVSHTTGQVSFQYPLGSLQPGVRFSGQLQTFYVWSVNPTAMSATVDVEQGSTSTLMASGTMVRVSPRYTGWDIMQALNDSLIALSSPSAGLFQMKAVELPYDASLTGYDMSLAPDLDQIYEVLASSPGYFKDWNRLHPSKLRLDRNADLTDFPSGVALNIWEPGYQGFNLRVVYKAVFGSFAALTDTLTSTGLPATCADLVCIGAAINLMAGKEIARNLTDIQGDTRRAAEVPAGAVGNSVQGLLRLYQQRLAAESGRLQRQWPSFKAG